jgi:VanZ family protein
MHTLTQRPAAWTGMTRSRGDVMTHSTPSRLRSSAAGRLWAGAAAFSAAGFVAALTLAPRAIVAPLHSLFTRATDAATMRLLVPVGYLDLDQALNTMLFVPLGATLALVLGRRAWPLAILAGFALSATVEYAQATIPGRVPDPQDIVWNTLGAAAGALVVGLAYGVAALSRRVRAARSRSAV